VADVEVPNLERFDGQLGDCTTQYIECYHELIGVSTGFYMILWADYHGLSCMNWAPHGTSIYYYIFTWQNNGMTEGFEHCSPVEMVPGILRALRTDPWKCRNKEVALSLSEASLPHKRKATTCTVDSYFRSETIVDSQT